MTLKNLKQSIDILKQINGQEILIYNCRIQIIQVIHMDIHKKWTTKTHSHSWYELHYINRGKSITYLDQQKKIIQAEQYYIIPPDTSHKHQQAPLKKGHEGLAIRWQIIAADKINSNTSIHLKQLEQGFADKKVHQADQLETMMNFIINLCLHFKPTKLNLLTQMGSLIISLSHHENILNTEQQPDLACSLSYQAKTFLEDNFSKKLNMKDVANILDVSYPYLAKKFKQNLNMTMVDYLQQIRIDETKKLLGNNKITLKEIADQVGFNNEYYLSKVFKQQLGISPSEYRKQITKL